VTDDNRDEDKVGGIPVRIWLLNEKEAIETILKETGENMFQENVDALIKRIIDDKKEIYSRRSDIKGVGIVYAEGYKFADLLTEAIQAYMLGMYGSTISLSCMAAERLCYDLIEVSNITINSMHLDPKTKTHLYKIPFSTLVDFLANINMIDEKAKSLLLRIGSTIRNNYLHPNMRITQDLKKDSLDALNSMCDLAKHLLSIFKFYDIEDGKLKRKPEYR
jgi:hypothetical protein